MTTTTIYLYAGDKMRYNRTQRSHHFERKQDYTFFNFIQTYFDDEIKNKTLTFNNYTNLMRASNYIKSFQLKILKLELNECYRNIYFLQKALKDIVTKLNNKVPYNILCNFICSQQKVMHRFYNKKYKNLNNKIDILKSEKYKKISSQ